MRLVQRKKTKLTVYRRHDADCPHKEQGREYIKCRCPLWVQGTHDSEPVRQSLNTRSMQEALRQVALLEDPHATVLKPIEEAATAYQNHIASLAPSTRRSYANIFRLFLAYCDQNHLRYMADLKTEDVDAYRATRQIAPSTSARELRILRLFLAFAQERRWSDDNPAEKIKGPRNIQPKPVVPYEPHEVTRMLATCETMGHSSYERKRARAMLLLMRYTGLRISDVATFARDRIRDGQIFLHTKKTGGLVFLPLPSLLEQELKALPLPRGAGEHSRYYFWNEQSSRVTMVTMAERTLRTVFKRSGVKHAHAHRFRHTLATELLARGYGEQDVADILGISPSIVRKHYAKWSVARQERINTIMREFYADALAPQSETSGRVN